LGGVKGGVKMDWYTMLHQIDASIVFVESSLERYRLFSLLLQYDF
jgi:hypothetical protein